MHIQLRRSLAAIYLTGMGIAWVVSAIGEFPRELNALGGVFCLMTAFVLAIKVRRGVPSVKSPLP
jgi:hypothetical protein